jgi:hypothetical protein
MARKPRSEWTEAYRRRIERAEARGAKTVQEARGHRPGEARERRERAEIAEALGITVQDRDRITRWYQKRFNADDQAGKPELEDVFDWVSENGYAAFIQWRKVWEGARRAYQSQIRRKTWESMGPAFLEILQLEAGVPDTPWVWYH